MALRAGVGRQLTGSLQMVSMVGAGSDGGVAGRSLVVAPVGQRLGGAAGTKNSAIPSPVSPSPAMGHAGGGCQDSG